MNTKIMFDNVASSKNIMIKGTCISFFRISEFLLFFLFLIVSHHGFGQETSSKIDKKDLRSFIKTLTSTQFGGRGIDDDGHGKTQEFITNRFKELQLEAFSSDGYLEKILLNQTSRGNIYVTTQNKKTLWNCDRMIFGGAIRHDLKEIEREVVFGGYGTEDELNQIKVENRYVLIFIKNTREEIDITNRLIERHANGLIIIRKDDENFESQKRRLKNFFTAKRYSIVERPDTMYSDSGLADPRIADIVAVNSQINTIRIPNSEIKNIIGLSKKELVNLADKRKINDVSTTVISINFEKVEKVVETANVIGVIKGESDKSIIISAHYDHLDRVSDIYYPGADDNASGVAALLELAEEFSQYKTLKYSMIFLAATAEEGGLLGSRYHIEQSGFDPGKVVLNVNIDMISRCDNKNNDCRYLYYIGSNQSEMLDSLAGEAIKLFPQYTLNYSEYNSDILDRSDTYNFKKEGINSIMFFSGFHDDYHKPTDTMDKIDFNILESRIKLISEFIKMAQKEDY